MADEIKQEIYEIAVGRLAGIKQSIKPGQPIPIEQLNVAMDLTNTIGDFIQGKRDQLELGAEFNPGVNIEEAQTKWKEAAETNQKMQDAIKGVKEEQLANPARVAAAPVEGDADGARGEAEQAKGPVLSQNPSLELNELLTSLVKLVASMTGTDPDLLTKGPAFVAAKKAEKEAAKDKPDDDNQQKAVAAAPEIKADEIAANKIAELAPAVGAMAKSEEIERVEKPKGLAAAVVSVAAFAGAAADALGNAAKEGSLASVAKSTEEAKGKLRETTEELVARTEGATAADINSAGNAAEASVALSQFKGTIETATKTIATGARSAYEQVEGMLASLGVSGDGQHLTAGFFPGELGQQQVRLPESPVSRQLASTESVPLPPRA